MSFLYKAHFQLSILPRSVVDPEPRSGIRCFFDPWIWYPGSGMVFFQVPERIPNPHFWEFSYNFLGKKFYSSSKTGPNFFLQHFKNKIINNFVEFVATKKGLTINIFSPLSLVNVFGSGIRDPRSEIRDPGWVKIRIRDPGSMINIPDPQHCSHWTRTCCYVHFVLKLFHLFLFLMCPCPKLPCRV